MENVSMKGFWDKLFPATQQHITLDNFRDHTTKISAKSVEHRKKLGNHNNVKRKRQIQEKKAFKENDFWLQTINRWNSYFISKSNVLNQNYVQHRKRGGNFFTQKVVTYNGNDLFLDINEKGTSADTYLFKKLVRIISDWFCGVFVDKKIVKNLKS